MAQDRLPARKPRVLMLTHQCAEAGGSFMRAVSLARPLAEMGYGMTLMAGRAQIGLRKIESDWHGVRIVQMPDVLPWRIRNAGLSPLDLCSRVAHVCRDQYDLFHVFDHRPSASLPALVRHPYDIPVVSDWADLWGDEGFADHRHEFGDSLLRLVDNFLEPYVHKRCDALTAISEDLRERALQLGVPGNRIRLVQVGANTDIVKPLEKGKARAKYQISEGVPVIVYCGFSAIDIDLLADTFVLLAKLVPRILLIMTGARVKPIEKMLAETGLSGQVRHFGTVPYEELGGILSCGDVCVLPYRDLPVNRARFPNRFGDYLAAGRPIATNLVGDHAVIVEQEGIGVVTAPAPQSFAEGIASLLANPERLTSMGARARQLATTRFSWKAVAAPVSELYAELLR